MTTIAMTGPIRQRSGLGAVRRRLRVWCDLWSERRALATLDPALLADLGIDPLDAAREAQRPAWDVPPARRI